MLAARATEGRRRPSRPWHGGVARPRRGTGRARAPRAAHTSGTRGPPVPRQGARPTPTRLRAPPRRPPPPPFARRAADRRPALTTYDPVGSRLHALLDPPPEPGREARHRARVTGRARRPDAQQERIAVAVVAQLLDRERVARRLPLAPEPSPRAAPEPRLATSRASAGAPPRPSTRASALDRSRRPGRSQASDPDVPSRLLELELQLAQPLRTLVHDRRDERRLGPCLERLREMARSRRRRRTR